MQMQQSVVINDDQRVFIAQEVRLLITDADDTYPHYTISQHQYTACWIKQHWDMGSSEQHDT